MALIYTPQKTFSNPTERVTNEAMQTLAIGIATVEPETIGNQEWNSTDMIALMAAVPTATKAVMIKITTLTVAGNTSKIIPQTEAAPAGATVDSVVSVVQTSDRLWFTGYIQSTPGLLGVPELSVKIVAHNLTTVSEDVVNGQPIWYAVFVDTKIKQPRSPNLQLGVTPQIFWTSFLEDDTHLPMSSSNLNRTALPKIAIPANSVTAIELNSGDIAKLASQYTGTRKIFTVPTTTAIPANSGRVYLGVTSFAGSAGPNVIVGQKSATPLYSGNVSSSNGATIVSIYARNNSFGGLSVPAGTQLKVLIF